MGWRPAARRWPLVVMAGIAGALHQAVVEARSWYPSNYCMTRRTIIADFEMCC